MAPQRKKAWIPKESSRFSTPAYIDKLKAERESSPILEKAQSIDQPTKLGTTKYKLFEMNKLRLECKELLKSTQEIAREMSSRNFPSKSINERKRLTRECATERSGIISNCQSSENCLQLSKYNITDAVPSEFRGSQRINHASIHTAVDNQYDQNPTLPMLKLPIINKYSNDRNSAPINPMLLHPKSVSIVRGQPIFAVRKKPVAQGDSPFDIISNLKERKDSNSPNSNNIKNRLHFLNRIPAEKKLFSGQSSPSRYFYDKGKEKQESIVVHDVDNIGFGDLC